MEIIKNISDIEGLILIEPDIYYDSRGYYFESYNYNKYFKDINLNFVQDNESKSAKGVLRGLHYQANEYAQSKLVRVISGAVFDVAVDIRKNSKTYGKYFSVILSGENKKQFFIPAGFAHGFLALEDNTIFSYKVDKYWNKESERGINLFDPNINIKWPKLDIEYIISDKDKKHPNL